MPTSSPAAAMALPVLLLTACFPRLSADLPERPTLGDDTAATSSGDDTTDTEELIDILIDHLDPVAGPTSGGTEVTIFGGPFDLEGLRAWFGAAEATIVSNSQSQLVVLVPPVDTGTEEVDVRVEAADGDGLAKDAYRYLDDAGGMARMLVSWTYYRPAYAGYWGEPDVFYLAAWALTVDPVDVAPWHFSAPEMDSCAANTPELTRYKAGDRVKLSSSMGEYALVWDDAAQAYVQTGYVEESYVADDLFDISMSGTDSFPEIELTNVMATPAVFTVDSPAIHEETIDEVTADPLQISWTGTNGDYVLIVLNDRNSDARLTCVAQDDGSFQVDFSTLSSFTFYWDWYWHPYGALVDMMVVSYSERDTVVAADNGEIRAQAGLGVYQTVWLYPGL